MTDAGAAGEGPVAATAVGYPTADGAVGAAPALALAFGAAASATAPAPEARTDPVFCWRSTAVTSVLSPVMAAADVGVAALAMAAAAVVAGAFAVAPATNAAALPAMGAVASSAGPLMVCAGFFLSCSTAPATSPLASLPIAVAGFTEAFAAAAALASSAGALTAAACAAGAEGGSVVFAEARVSPAFCAISSLGFASVEAAAAGFGPSAGMGAKGFAV
mmetsp:Transcript_28659/g.74610  ORF Transcript_28659/g.74610 Transcript_28659/m.74610 type:complete len:219 (-) Transcript_28659:119-775(-)